MALKTNPATREQKLEQQRITIERREVVAEIELGNGTQHPVEVAFTAMGKYFAENDDQQGYTVGFTLWEREFTAELGPAPQMPSSKTSRRDEDDF